MYVGAAAAAYADDLRAPDPLLADPAALKSAFAARIAHPVNVMQAMLGERYVNLVVQDARGNNGFDTYSALPGAVIGAHAAGDVSCGRKKIASPILIWPPARALAQARAIATANGYRNRLHPTAANVFCNDFGWRIGLSSDIN